MELTNISIRDSLTNIYLSFEESLREAFLSTITQQNVMGLSAYIKNFDSLCLKLSQRYLELIDTFTLLTKESSATNEFTRFSNVLKRYIAEDIQNMKRLIKTFVIRASNNVNAKAELLTVFSQPRVYNIATLGRPSKRALYV